MFEESFRVLVKETVREVIREELAAIMGAARAQAPAGAAGGEDEWLTPAEAARALKVHPATLRRWRSQGLVQTDVIGGTPRLSRRSLREAMAAPRRATRTRTRAETPEQAAARVVGAS